jgi:hypothetical protein
MNASTEQLIYLTCSGSIGERVFAILLTSGWGGVATLQQGLNITNGAVAFTANTIYTGNVNFADSTSPYYVKKLFPNDYTGFASNTLVTLLALPQAASGMTTWSAHTGTVGSTPFVIIGYRNASTPMIVSDITISGGTGRNLFTIHTISDGYEANKVRIAIEDIDTTANTFDIVVRDYSDRNDRQIVLERFSKLSMTKSASTYVAKMIGDSVNNTGEFNLISKYIYVTVESGDHSGLVPAGYGKISAPAFASTRPLLAFPVKQVYDSTISTSRQYLGLDVSRLDADHTMTSYAAQWDHAYATGSTCQYLKGFHLNALASTAEYDLAYTSLVGLSGMTKEQRKFIAPVVGGRDGWLRRERYRTLLASTPSTTTANSYKSAIDLLANPEEIDINLLVIPGVSLVSSIGTYAITMVEDRADAVYIGDFPDNITTAAGAVAQITSLDSSYAATYWPYVQFYDIDNTQYLWRPATPFVLEAIAYTDNIADPWWAPAGLNRGLLTTVSKAKYKLTSAEREELYEGRVNPIATFPTQGAVIWGQKTLQVRSTSLDRINVRRMVLYAKKVIAGATKYLVFDQNDQATWDRFKALVNPVLDTIKVKRGLVDFRVIMDETTNTPDIIDRNQMVGYVYLKPTKTAEVITIYFTLLPQGALFEE